MERKWVMCPVCHNKTRLQLREDTVINNLMLYCPKCRQEKLINVKEFRVEVIG
ncbi:MAG: cysteine-rich KTR domain-containing protein [Lachnospiraceae bacterium]|nr:cysteine-rich KTR domain-containing protein [Lachnospiraceae bacterium]